MTINQLSVPFHNERIVLLEVDGEPFVPVRPLAERFGIAWQAQHRKLQMQKQRLSVTIMMTETPAGPRETTCIPLRKLPAWLYSIHPNKVAEPVREALICYQSECDDVLWRHWSGQHREETETLRRQNKALRALCLAFNPVWGKIAALQQAGLASWSIRFHLKRSRDDTRAAIAQMEEVGIIAHSEWDDEKPDEDTQVQGELTLEEVHHA